LYSDTTGEIVDELAQTDADYAAADTRHPLRLNYGCVVAALRRHLIIHR
jgi:hypothetical protein